MKLRRKIQFLSRLPKRFSFALRRMTLRARMTLLLGFLILAIIVFFCGAMYQQYKMAINASNVAVGEYSILEKSVRLREILSEIDRAAHYGDTLDSHGVRFRNVLDHLDRLNQSQGEAADDAATIGQIDERFDAYWTYLRAPEDRVRRNALLSQDSIQEIKTRYEDVAASVNSLIETKESRVYRLAQELRQSQEDSIRLIAVTLFFFVTFLMLGGFKLLSIVTDPLSNLSNFLDQVNVEDDIPQALPNSYTTVPEVARVARSFEQLLFRLRGYRMLNVRRLLIEKRRADIIAASISDGIFLMRGEELLYVNPVGERILDLPDGRHWKGLNVATFVAEQRTLPPQGAARAGEEKRKRSGAKAIHQAILRTMPIEFEVDATEGRNFTYLLQSFPISEAVIEQVEHSFNGPIEQLLDRWQATTLVLAQDVSLVREGQEAKSHFIATLSHEVKTPVTSLTMATRLLKKSIDQFPNPTHRSLIQTCADDVDRLRKLIDDLLSVSRFDTLTQKIDWKSVDLSKLVKQSVQHFHPQAFERGIEISVNYAEGARSLHVPMDASKVSWAISNLLTNALRHTPKGGKVEALISLQGGHAEVRIKDTGPGIDKSRQDRLFDKFNPFYDLRIARSGSVGMGLAIAREIIVAHGGRIWVTSEPGHGAEFYFVLPTIQVNRNIVKGDNSGTSASG